jgi:cell division protein FtsA
LEIEAVLVALDVGTSKTVVLVGEVTREGSLDIIGKGTSSSTGLRKGVVINIEQTVNAIRGAVEQAERLSGLRLEAAFVGVGGAHVESLNSTGTVAVSGAHREVGREDIDRATEVARAVTIPSNREVLHVLPRDFTVDGLEGVRDPLGMSAIRLEVTTHIVHASATALQNLTKCVRQAGVRPDELVAASIASGEAVLSETERELGVAVADIGAGSTDIALYAEGSPFRTSVVPLGGVNVTNDIAIGLKTNLVAAEQLKIRYGSIDPSLDDPDEEIPVELIEQGGTRAARRGDVAEIIEARMRELFEKIGDELDRGGQAQRLPAGLVLTGGGSLMGGASELGREVLGIPVRLAAPTGVGGLTDHLLTPAHSTSIGLLLWAAHVVTGQESERIAPQPPPPPSLGRLREWGRRLFP